MLEKPEQKASSNNRALWEEMLQRDPVSLESNGVRDPETLISQYLERDEKDRLVQFERGPNSTPFARVGERSKDQFDNSRVHFLFPGVMAGPNETFTPVVEALGGEKKLREDVYAPDRTGDFSAEHALNGIIDVLNQNPNYQKIEIFAVSVGASIAKALDGDPRIREINESGREIILTYYDPYDLDDFAYGVNADKNSVIASLQRRGIEIASGILPWISKPLNSIILEKGGSVGEESSLGFLLGQFTALGDTHIINPETGKFYYQGHISGSIEAGTRGLDGKGSEDSEHNDIFMDKNERIQKFRKVGAAVFLHAGTHGATENNYPGGTKTKPARKNPVDAYKELLGAIGWQKNPNPAEPKRQ